MTIENIDHPRHYTSHPSGVECITVTEHMSFNAGNAIKYLWRADLKNGVEDLRKAAWYVAREIERRAARAERGKGEDTPEPVTATEVAAAMPKEEGMPSREEIARIVAHGERELFTPRFVADRIMDHVAPLVARLREERDTLRRIADPDHFECHFCGLRDILPADVVAHVETCPKHPSAKLRAELEAVTKRLADKPHADALSLIKALETLGWFSTHDSARAREIIADALSAGASQIATLRAQAERHGVALPEREALAGVIAAQRFDLLDETLRGLYLEEADACLAEVRRLNAPAAETGTREVCTKLIGPGLRVCGGVAVKDTQRCQAHAEQAAPMVDDLHAAIARAAKSEEVALYWMRRARYGMAETNVVEWETATGFTQPPLSQASETQPPAPPAAGGEQTPMSDEAIADFMDRAWCAWSGDVHVPTASLGSEMLRKSRCIRAQAARVLLAPTWKPVTAGEVYEAVRKDFAARVWEPWIEVDRKEQADWNKIADALNAARKGA